MNDFLAMIKGYQKILEQIEIHRVLKLTAEKDRQYYEKQMMATAPHDISGMAIDGQPHGNFSPISLDRANAERLKAINREYKEQAEIIRLTKAKEEIEYRIKRLPGIEYKVAYKRLFERNKDGTHKTLEQIADEMNYNYNYIQNVSSNIAKKINIKAISKQLSTGGH